MIGRGEPTGFEGVKTSEGASMRGTSVMRASVGMRVGQFRDRSVGQL